MYVLECFISHFSVFTSRAYRARYLDQPLPPDNSETLTIVANASKMYKELPKTPAKTAFLHDLTIGVTCKAAADALSLDLSTVWRASAYTGRPWVEFQRQLGFPRANRAESHRFLLDLPCESFEFIDSEQYMCCSTVGSMNLSFLMLEMGLAT